MNTNEALFSAKRPDNGQEIEVQFPDGIWRSATYFKDDGIDGAIVDEDGHTIEIEEYGHEMLWRPIQPKPANTGGGQQ